MSSYSWRKKKTHDRNTINTISMPLKVWIISFCAPFSFQHTEESESEYLLSQYKFTRKSVFCKRFWQNATSQCFKPKYRCIGRCEWSDPALPSPSNTEWLQVKWINNVRSQCCKPVHRCVWRCGWSGPLLPSLSNTQKRLRLTARKANVLNLKRWCFEDVKDDNARCFFVTLVFKTCKRLRFRTRVLNLSIDGFEDEWSDPSLWSPPKTYKRLRLNARGKCRWLKMWGARHSSLAFFENMQEVRMQR